MSEVNSILLQSPERHVITQPRAIAASGLLLGGVAAALAFLGARAANKLDWRGAGIGIGASVVTALSAGFVNKPSPITEEVKRMEKLLADKEAIPAASQAVRDALKDQGIQFGGKNYHADQIYMLRLQALVDLSQAAAQDKNKAHLAAYKARAAFFEGLGEDPMRQDTYDTRLAKLKEAYGKEWVDEVAKANAQQVRRQMWAA